MEKALRYERILNSLAAGVFAVDREFRITFFNTQAERLTGFTRQEAMGRKCFEIFRTEHCRNDCNIERAIHKDLDKIKVRVLILSKKNLEIPVQVTATVLRDEEGQIVGGVESFLDDRARSALEKEVRKIYTFDDIISRDETVRQMIDILPTIASSENAVLILGETGVGKDVLARAIHNASPRSKGPFVKVNCAALSPTLLESELFGYKKGAFTDAKKDKPGRFQLAEGGTIFLDEIAELAPDVQAKLLHVLEDREFYPLGSTKTLRVDVRVIAATNRRLNEMTEKNTFRTDLYYRLKVCEIEIPPLRERLCDLPILIEHFIEQAAAIQNKDVSGISTEAIKVLLRHSYPGNVRELKNVIEYAVMLCRGRIQREDLPKYLLRPGKDAAASPVESASAPLSLDAGEKDTLLRALQANNWQIENTARGLGINRTTLWRKMKKHGLAARTRA
jgi:PAS domain S-box-containing protein